MMKMKKKKKKRSREHLQGISRTFFTYKRLNFRGQSWQDRGRVRGSGTGPYTESCSTTSYSRAACSPLTVIFYYPQEVQSLFSYTVHYHLCRHTLPFCHSANRENSLFPWFSAISLSHPAASIGPTWTVGSVSISPGNTYRRGNILFMSARWPQNI